MAGRFDALAELLRRTSSQPVADDDGVRDAVRWAAGMPPSSGRPPGNEHWQLARHRGLVDRAGQLTAAGRALLDDDAAGAADKRAG